ncbi:MAG: multiheme c-type cytochrome, partial [Gemmatimonadales bacterium]
MISDPDACEANLFSRHPVHGRRDDRARHSHFREAPARTALLSRQPKRWGPSSIPNLEPQLWARPRGCILPLLLGCLAGPALAQDPGVDQLHVEALEYPLAVACGTCHPTHFRQWSVSPHAYSQISPVFNAMHATVTKLTNGTSGDFCIRCHTPIGMARGEEVFISNLQRSEASREGVTCTTCHRVNQAFGKISGRMSINAGDIYQPISGPTGSDELRRAQEDPDLNLATADERTRRRSVHLDVERFFQLPTSGFCGTCHDVTSLGGFRLEEAFSEYKNSPAAKRGVSCQDCHMGVTPGTFSGEPETNYAFGPAATVRGRDTAPRRLTNHTFAGPDHSIVHPGIFPHNSEAAELATLSEWLQFDYEAGWGTDVFEDAIPEDYEFPDRWADLDDRFDARLIIDDQIELLNEYMGQHTTVLRNGYQIGEIVTQQANRDGIRFKVNVRNATDGHNVPTGFIAERLVYLQITVLDSEGDTVFVSGDLDPNGDLRDSHSIYVHDGELPRDKYLFSLQSNFLTRNVRGGEREQVLAVNFSLDPLPFARPSTFATVLTGRARGARIHRKGISPLGSRWANYKVEKEALTGNAPYRATVRLVAGMVPVNLVHAIQEVGFDYGMSA